MAVLLIAEHDNKILVPATAKALTAARGFGKDVDILVAGQDCRAVAEQAAKLEGVRKVLIADAPYLAQRVAEETAATLVPLMQNYDVLLAPATTMGKNVLPRVAALLDVAQVSDIVEVKSPNTFVRPIYAGNALEAVETTDKIVVGTVRTTAFSAVGEGGSASIESVTPVSGSTRVTPARMLPVSESPSPFSRMAPPVSMARAIRIYVPSTTSSRACHLPMKYW